MKKKYKKKVSFPVTFYFLHHLKCEDHRKILEKKESNTEKRAKNQSIENSFNSKII